MSREQIEAGNEIIKAYQGGICHFNDTVGFHSSWDWQIPVWAKVHSELPGAASDNDVLFLKVKWLVAINDNLPEDGFAVLVEAIEFINKNK